MVRCYDNMLELGILHFISTTYPTLALISASSSSSNSSIRSHPPSTARCNAVLPNLSFKSTLTFAWSNSSTILSCPRLLAICNAVWPSRFCTSRPLCRASSVCTTSSCLFCTARWRAVRPDWSCSPMLDSRPRSRLTLVCRPASAAKCRAVLPLWESMWTACGTKDLVIAENFSHLASHTLWVIKLGEREFLGSYLVAGLVQ